jgi:hypothetical protein
VNCKDCQFWEAPSTANCGVEDDENYRYTTYGFGVCTLSESIDGVPTNQSLAFARDYETYMASLRTKPEFGCVQFKLKVVP